MRATISVLILHLTCFHMRLDESNSHLCQQSLGLFSAALQPKGYSTMTSASLGMDKQLSGCLHGRLLSFPYCAWTRPLHVVCLDSTKTFCFLFTKSCSETWDLSHPQSALNAALSVPWAVIGSSHISPLSSFMPKQHTLRHAQLSAQQRVSNFTWWKRIHTGHLSLKGLLTFCLFTQKQMFKHLFEYCEIFSQTGHLVPAV